jgi:hypothetical protein
MTTLFSYCIPYDDGAAPNPFWDLCTLVICKPAIRRVARVGDWIVGTGSKHSPIGDVSGHVVYAMRVSEKLLMEEYDAFTRTELPPKLPSSRSSDRRRRVGDSLYDFSRQPPRLRQGVHLEKNRVRDLGGLYALLSDHFYYFGSQPVALPEELLPIVRQGQGYQSGKNAPYVGRFLEWIESLGYGANEVHAIPQTWVGRGVAEVAEGACGGERRSAGSCASDGTTVRDEPRRGRPRRQRARGSRCSS